MDIKNKENLENLSLEDLTLEHSKTLKELHVDPMMDGMPWKAFPMTLIISLLMARAYFQEDGATPLVFNIITLGVSVFTVVAVFKLVQHNRSKEKKHSPLHEHRKNIAAEFGRREKINYLNSIQSKYKYYAQA